MATYTDYPEILKLVSDYKTALAVWEAAREEVNAVTPTGLLHTPEYQAALWRLDAKQKAVQEVEARLCAAFVWALEHSDETGYKQDTR